MDDGGDGGVDAMFTLLNGELIEEPPKSVPRDAEATLLLFQATTFASMQMSRFDGSTTL